MITFSNLGRHGRLGNAMFQYAAVKSLAHKLNCIAKIPPNLCERTHHGQKCLLKNFNIECDTYEERELENLTTCHENCEGGQYNPEFWNFKENTNLIGHFESELYFEPVKEQIIKEFQVKPELDKYAENYISNIKKTYNNSTIIAIHFRRGDFKDISLVQPFCQEEWNSLYTSMAIKEFDDIPNKIFLVFTGGSTSENNNNNEDMEWCKSFMKGDNILYCTENDTIRDFSIMTKCDHLVTNTMSSMAWCSGYLNKNHNKKIVVPDIDYKSKETYWPKDFIKVSI